MVPLAKVPHCILEPLNLVFRVSADHTAPHNVLKQLISCLFKRGRLDDLSSTT
jgi:hypothetical protein